MKRVGDEFDISTATELLLCAQVFLLGFFIVGGLFHHIFAELESPNCIFAVCFVVASLSITGVVWLCKLFVDFVHRKLKVEDLTKYRNEYLIGFGTLGISSVVLRVLVYFPELGAKTFGFVAPVYVITITAIYCFFVLPTFDEKCTWVQMDEERGFKFFCTHVLVHIVVLIVCIIIAYEYEDSKTISQIIILQLWLTIPSAFTFADFAQVWWVGVQLINVNGGRNEIVMRTVESRRSVHKISAKQEPKPISEAVAPKPNCNICSFPYTETGIHSPRMLRECGHTICEQCASKLLNVKMQNRLVCPFCQKVTVVNGPAGTLPKNFALLEYRRDVVQRN